MAEREGFEPTVPAKEQLFSRQPHSTTLPSLPCILYLSATQKFVCVGKGYLFRIALQVKIAIVPQKWLYHIDVMSILSKKYPLQKGAQNPILRTKAQKIEQITPEIRNFALDLMELMREYEWVGLAAPQVGKSWRIIATTQRKHNKRGEKNTGETIMINPEILEKSQEMTVEEEACLSLPDLRGNVARHKKITVSYIDEDGKAKTKKYSDFDAIIIQHEIDHLDGILFIDKIIESKAKKTK
jgi:peptide deformylase